MSEEDRISQLPDDVLFHILSFLTTKEAIVTSLLSTRWRLLCSMLPYIDIRCTKKQVRHDHSQLSSRCHYIRRMAAILYRVCSKPIIEYQEKVNAFLGRLRSEYIASFSLHCKSDRCCSRFVEEWVSAMVARKVGKLDIQLGTYKSMEFSFPHLFTSSSIVTLNIKGPIDLYVPSSVHLPNLKSLNIRVNACIPASNAKALISGSPALEFFYLFYYMEHEMRHCFCQQLTMVRHSRGMHFFRDHSLLYNIHVLTENRHFDVILDFEERDLWPNVVTESVYLTSYLNIKQKTFGEILHALRNVKFLSLRCFRNSRHSPIDIIPLFKNLVELKLFIQREDLMSTAFPYHKCPSLEVIEFNIMDSFYGISERYRYRFVGRVKQLDLSIVPVNPKTIEVRKVLGSPPWIDWSIDSVFSRWPFTFSDDED